MSNMLLGLELIFLGMFVVFSILVLLFLSIVVLGRVMRGGRKARVAPVPVTRVPGEEKDIPDNRVVAAISAALSEYLRVPGGVRLGKVTRVEQPSSAWASAGRLDIMNGRFERTGQ